MQSALATIFRFANWLGLSYFLALNTIYLLLIVIAAVNLGGYLRRKDVAVLEDVLTSPATLPVSVIMPAHNEELGIVESTRAILALEYPQLELIVIDDGSSDYTFSRLRDAFDLVEAPVNVPRLVPAIGEILSVHLSRTDNDLTVIRKRSVGKKTDAANTGINIAKYPIVCIVDADAVLDPDALIKVTKPFADDPQRVVATGGAIRPSNGCTLYRGRVTSTSMPSNRLARMQVVEYLRAFLLGRTGWSKLGALLIISGAFGVFRKDLLIEIGGYDLDSIGEDADLVARLHRHLTNAKRNYRITFVSEPVCWTEVPEDTSILRAQRRRWSRGLVETIWNNRGMIFNPRYGTLGLIAIPYFILFEILGPVVELAGFLILLLALIFNFVNIFFAGLFFSVAILYGVLLSILSLFIEELSYHRFSSWTDLARAVLSSITENFGYRQLHAYWRLEGVVQAVLRTRASWGTMSRKGFTSETQPQTD